MNSKITIYYNGEQDDKVDEGIRKGMEREGFEWIGQGYYFKEQRRDITFEVKNEKV